MIDRERFQFLKNKYGHWSSWAIWSEAGETPKSNIGDLSIFDGDNFLPLLNPEVVLVGLNVSRGDIKYPLGNFHDARSEGQDYKLRFALKDSWLWGGYLTDIIKDLEQPKAGEVLRYLRANPEVEKSNVQLFREELSDLNAKNPTIIALGDAAFKILKRNLKKEYRVLKILHFSSYAKLEKLRASVSSIVFES